MICGRLVSAVVAPTGHGGKMGSCEKKELLHCSFSSDVAQWRLADGTRVTRRLEESRPAEDQTPADEPARSSCAGGWAVSGRVSRLVCRTLVPVLSSAGPARCVRSFSNKSLSLSAPTPGHAPTTDHRVWRHAHTTCAQQKDPMGAPTHAMSIDM